MRGQTGGDTQADALDCVRAFDRGCDDCVSRPFQYDELLARIRAVLRRAAPPERDRLHAGPIVVNLVTRRATVHGRGVALPAKEYELLAKLASNRTASSRRSSCFGLKGGDSPEGPRLVLSLRMHRTAPDAQHAGIASAIPHDAAAANDGGRDVEAGRRDEYGSTSYGPNVIRLRVAP